MRVHRLEVAGFGPFRGQQIVDFEQFADDGIFLITGKTGAGKSSILDAVCFALYDSVPRYENTGRRLRSDHAREGEPTRVALEFTAGGERYRVERTPEYQRPKKHGTGLTLEKASAHLAQWIDGEWVGLAARAKEVGELLGEILGLTREQFLQVILLAQNRFAQFLQADQPQRQALLRTLFGTRRFEEYEEALETRRREARARVDRGSDGLLAAVARAERVVAEAVAVHEDGEIAHAALEQGTEAGVTVDAGHKVGGIGVEAGVAAGHGAATLRERVAAADLAALRLVAWRQAGEAGVEATAADRARLEEQVSHFEAVRKSQLRKAAAQRALVQLEEDETAIAVDREVLRRAGDADAVRGAIRTAEVAETALAAATDDAAAMLRAWLETGEAELTRTALDELIDAEVRTSGGLSAAAAAEERMSERENAVATSELEVRALAEQIADAEVTQANIPGDMREVDEALAAAQTLAAGSADARSRVTELESAFHAATEAGLLVGAAHVAHEVLRDAGIALTGASADVDRLRDLRLRGFAAELARELVAGEACAVCGSLEHPAPRPVVDGAVTQAQIDAATAHRDVCAERERDANERARAADHAVAEAQARAGGRKPGDIEPLLAAAAQQLTAAEAATAEHETLKDRRAELFRAQETGAVVIGELRQQQLAAIAAHAQAESVLSAAISTVTAARGEFITVLARKEASDRRIARARQLATAQTVHAACLTDAAAAQRARDAELVARGFDSADAAIEAQRSAADRAEIEARVRHHDEQRAHYKSVLLEPELLALPEELIDVEAARAVASTARERHDAAVRGQARIEALSRQLQDALAEAGRTSTAVAALEAELEVIERLANTVAGRAPNTHRMKLESFVLAAELEEIVEAANRRLALMSGERYRLAHTDAREARGKQSGLGLSVMDQHTGRARATHSLSGGETFLASLALALGLAEVVSARAGGITLDTLFIDEGFGSLDSATLDTAMATLDELRQGGRVVGLISHVEAMKEQIHAQLVIDVAPEGWSEVREVAGVAS